MKIRPAGPDDIAAMHALRMRVAENALADPGRVTEDSYRPYLARGAAWVAETERGLAGFAVLDLAGRSVWALFVAPEAERMGIGRALHARLLHGAISNGLTRLSLRTASGTRAERFYSRAGWTRGALAQDGELSFVMELSGGAIREGETA